jgi:hypothetical protein
MAYWNKFRIILSTFLVLSFAGFIIYVIFTTSAEVTSLRQAEKKLKQKIVKLKAKGRTCENNMSSICYAGADYQSDVSYIDCGESFIERWATCLCTTMCLEDFTVTVTNRKRCRNWPSVPIQIRPEPDEEEEEDEEEN